MSEILKQLKEAVVVGEPDQARELATQALEADIAPLTAIEEALNVGMQVVGDKFESEEYFIPDLMMATEAMKILSGHPEAVSPYLLKVDRWTNALQRLDMAGRGPETDCPCCRKHLFEYLECPDNP